MADILSYIVITAMTLFVLAGIHIALIGYIQKQNLGRLFPIGAIFILIAVALATWGMFDSSISFNIYTEPAFDIALGIGILGIGLASTILIKGEEKNIVGVGVLLAEVVIGFVLIVAGGAALTVI